MKDKNYDDELSSLIRASIDLSDIPSPELNSSLKAALYRKEADIARNGSTHSIALWYMPMILNFITFSLFAIFALMMIANPYLAAFIACLCGYIGIAGIILTIIGVRRAGLKDDITLHIGKRGAFT